MHSRLDFFEHVFDSKGVSITEVEASGAVPPEQQIERLRARMQQMEQVVSGQEIPTHPALRGLLQLRAGGAYAVDGLPLALAVLAGPSAAGEWCAVVGEPDFGAEAASELGVVLERTVLVPDPGESWLEATAALVDVATLVVVRPPVRVAAGTAERLRGRLRKRGAALVATGPHGLAWPRAEARLTAVAPQWQGLGRGEGHLRSRQLTVEVRRGAARPRRAQLWLPGDDGGVRQAGRVETGRLLEVAG